MASVIFENTLTDSGVAELGGTRVFYVAWEVTVAGPTIRPPATWDSDAIIGAGHWSLGNDLTSLGVINGVAFDAPHWLYAEKGQWIAQPGVVGTEFSASIAQYIQWTFAPGTEVHLYVFGDA